MKKISTLVSLFFLNTAMACWYVKSNYTDYISEINGIQVLATNYVNGVVQYSISNNQTVDLPLTVSMKLISDQEVNLNANDSGYASELLRGRLQYRVLPAGNWITVQEYSTPSGTISKDSEPKTYFGKNNIWPKNLRAGDVIMVRLYITDGIWQSGQLSDKCEDKLTSVVTQYGTKISLPNTFTYLMNGSDVLQYDFGGAWYPHFAITVIYSGKERPLR